MLHILSQVPDSTAAAVIAGSVGAIALLGVTAGLGLVNKVFTSLVFSLTKIDQKLPSYGQSIVAYLFAQGIALLDKFLAAHGHGIPLLPTDFTHLNVWAVGAAGWLGSMGVHGLTGAVTPSLVALLNKLGIAVPDTTGSGTPGSTTASTPSSPATPAITPPAPTTTTAPTTPTSGS